MIPTLREIRGGGSPIKFGGASIETFSGTLIPVSIDLCTVRRDGAPDFRRIYVPIFGIMTILIISGAPDFSSGAHFLQGWLAQGHISQKKQK